MAYNVDRQGNGTSYMSPANGFHAALRYLRGARAIGTPPKVFFGS